MVPITALGWGWMAPTTITARVEMTNTAAGSIKSLADSEIPNMFTIVSSARPMSATAKRWCERDGKMLPRLAAPTARLTATVKT